MMMQRLTVLFCAVVLACSMSGCAQLAGRKVAGPARVVSAPLVLLTELKGLKLDRHDDAKLCILGIPATGKSHMKGTTNVKVYQQGTSKIYDLTIEGEINSQSISHAPAVQVYSHGQSRFHGQRRIVFDGKKFLGEPAQVTIHHRAFVEGIQANRGGAVLGTATSTLARPIVNMKLPESERIVALYIHDRVTESFEQDSDRAIRSLSLLVNQPKAP